MLKRLLLGGVAAGAIAVPLAGAAWAQPGQPVPPPAPPPGAGENAATCIVDDVFPSNLDVVDADQASTEADWREAGQLQVPFVGPLAGELGVAPGQTVSVYCTPGGFQAIRWNPQAQPAPQGQPSPLAQQNPAQQGQPSPLAQQNPGQQSPQMAPTGLSQQNPQPGR